MPNTITISKQCFPTKTRKMLAKRELSSRKYNKLKTQND